MGKQNTPNTPNEKRKAANVKSLAALQALCLDLGITVMPTARPSKEPYIDALRQHFWRQEHPGVPLPEQIEPMLLDDWRDLDDAEAEAIHGNGSGWCVQEKKDGVRALLHVTPDGIRITGRNISEVTYRLSEFQDNLPHLATGLDNLVGTVLDGELACPAAVVDTGDTITASALQATTAILAASPEKAKCIQSEHAAELEFHVFDILRYKGQHMTVKPLSERLAVLSEAHSQTTNEFIVMVPTDTVDKPVVHEQLVRSDAEGTVFKKLDQPYQPGKRVKHWIKRKCGIEVEAFVSGFKPGSPGRGNSNLVGAVEFSVPDLSLLNSEPFHEHSERRFLGNILTLGIGCVHGGPRRVDRDDHGLNLEWKPCSQRPPPTLGHFQTDPLLTPPSGIVPSPS